MRRVRAGAHGRFRRIGPSSRRVKACVIAASILLAQSASAQPSNPCAGILPNEVRAPVRALVPVDLVRLRDIGPVDPFQQGSGLFSVSPDGSRAALQIRRADPVGNDYCLAMIIVDLAGKRPALIVDEGGDFIRLHFDLRGKHFPSGFAAPVSPRWSMDGQWIVFRRKDGDAVQLWRARADGTGSERLTDSRDDIEDFGLTADGKSLVYSTKPGLREALDAIEKEGRLGFHYDGRFLPTASSRPQVATSSAQSVWILDLATRIARPANASESAVIGAPEMREGNWSVATSGGAASAWIEVPGPESPGAGSRLLARLGGRNLSCDAPECSGAASPWWYRGKVRFLRHEGPRRSVTSIYEWMPGELRPRRLYRTEDLLLNCIPSNTYLTCLREGSVQPRRLERLDPASGRRVTLFDPNPEFRKLTLGRAERVRSRNSFGLDSFADIVYPVGFEPGRRYPLIVVQYHSRGFLRGGTGDEYPIQAFANRGFAVISVDKPEAVGARAVPDYVEGDRINLKDFADRRSVLEAVEAPVRLTIQRGIADPKRIGITGLSDGSSTANFALLHSNLFSAYAMSSCCWDTNLSIRVGPETAKIFQRIGYPAYTDESPEAAKFWKQIAISPNARSITQPILLQMSDDEYWMSLQSYTALREVNRPVELYVFPGEHHVKWQPAHRLAVYERSIDWFDYWLNGKRDFGPARAEDVARWDALRAEAHE